MDHPGLSKNRRHHKKMCFLFFDTHIPLTSKVDQHAVLEFDLNTCFVFVGAQTLQDFADVSVYSFSLSLDIYIHTYMHAYIYTCIHTRMHACIHTYALSLQL
jgi:hypothetical protein